MREVASMNMGWLFHKGDIPEEIPQTNGPIYDQCKTERKLIGPAAYLYYDDPNPKSFRHPGKEMRAGGWEKCNLPHDYLISQAPDANACKSLGYLQPENAWYRKHFTLKPEWEGKRLILQFEGIAIESTVYLNGCLLERNFSSYNSFEVEIGDYVYFDRENVLAVYVFAKTFDGWWYNGAGIYRDVNLIVTDSVAIELYGVYAPAKKMNDEIWSVDYEVSLCNTTDLPTAVRVESRLLDRSGSVVAVAEGSTELSARCNETVCYSAQVDHPHLWSVEEPYLYTVRTVLYRENQPIDDTEVRIGFRTVEVSAERGLLLNGKSVKIKGVCCHQDFGLTGVAVPANVAKYKVRLIKEMGANGYRCSHYQNSSAVMDALDEQGFLVMAETRWFDSSPEGLKQLRTLVKRERNRPSVIFWSTGNEEYLHVDERGGRIQRAMAAEIRKYDNTRLIVSAQSHSPLESKIYDDCDVIAVNYNMELCDALHEKYPDKAILFSECCATGSTRDWYFDSDDGRMREEDFDPMAWNRSREYTWKIIAPRDYVIGGYQWDAIEHRGEANWPALCSKCGALDLFLQRKGAFYQNLSHWTDEPMVHLVPHWNFFGKEGCQIEVHVYTNCETVELFLNEKALGKKTVEPYGKAVWEVPYAPGELKCVGQKGNVTVVDLRKTTGAPVRLKLSQQLGMRANDQDVGLYLCECVDDKGNVVPDASPLVQFSVSSPAYIVGTGSDHCDHIPVPSPTRRMYQGKILVAVRMAESDHKIRLTAQSEHLGCCEFLIKPER